jgi:ABC-type phosphate transport system substrate-binding protein
VTSSWLLLYGNYPDLKKARSLKAFVNWGITDCQKYAEKLGFICLPPHIQKLGVKAVETIQ